MIFRCFPITYYFTSTIRHVNKTKPINLFVVLMPGILIAGTGVGAGDLATASFTGSQLGLAVLWAVEIGRAHV